MARHASIAMAAAAIEASVHRRTSHSASTPIAHIMCVPLISERELLNLQVEPLTVYHVCRKRGIGLLEPVPPAAVPPEMDFRLDAFFLFGRPAMQRRPKTIRAA